MYRNARPAPKRHVEVPGAFVPDFRSFCREEYHAAIAHKKTTNRQQQRLKRQRKSKQRSHLNRWSTEHTIDSIHIRQLSLGRCGLRVVSMAAVSSPKRA